MRGRAVVGVTSEYYLNSYCRANFTAKNKSSFHWVFIFAKARITPSIWSNMSLYTAMTRCRVTVCCLDIHRVRYQNGLKDSMMYLTIVHSSCVVKSGHYALYFGFLSHSRVNSHNRYTHLSNSSVEFHGVFTSIIGCTAMRNLAFWQSINLFRWPGVSVINTANIHCYTKVSFSTFQNSSNMYFFDYFR